MKSLLMILVMLAGGFASAASSEDVQREAGEAAETAADYARESKEEFSKKMRSNLDQIETSIAELKARASTAAGGARTKLEKQISNLEGKRDEMKVRLDKFSSSSDRAWKKMKTGLERAWQEVKVAYGKASHEFEEEEKDEQ